MPRLELTVERIEDGEVSPYLAGVAARGRRVRGARPGRRALHVAGASDGGPLLLVAGGSGLVPLMAMLRHRAAQGSDVDARLLVSARALGRRALPRRARRARRDVRVTSRSRARSRRAGAGSSRRVDADMLRELGPAPERAPARVRVRPDRVRRARGRPARRARPRPAARSMPSASARRGAEMRRLLARRQRARRPARGGARRGHDRRRARAASTAATSGALGAYRAYRRRGRGAALPRLRYAGAARGRGRRGPFSVSWAGPRPGRTR